ncbi:hypothetical protein B0H13DRAFT_2045764 [Mycena leptocephala]|nr:hypothetical protein B0H13DRAFT_2045764 [Mycena leptocephala]
MTGIGFVDIKGGGAHKTRSTVSPRFGMSLRRWGRKGRIKAPHQAAAQDTETRPSTSSLSVSTHSLESRSTIGFEAIVLSLNVAKESTDIFPPLKSIIGGVLAVLNIAQRVAAIDENAQMLACRAITILDTIYNAIGDTESEALSSSLLEHMVDFERLLNEMHHAMSQIRRWSRMRRFLHLRRAEDDLQRFNSRLDATTQAFTLGAVTRVEVAVEKVHIDLAAVHAELSTVSLALEKAITMTHQLHDQVKFFRAVVFLA